MSRTSRPFITQAHDYGAYCTVECARCGAEETSIGLPANVADMRTLCHKCCVDLLPGYVLNAPFTDVQIQKYNELLQYYSTSGG